jgi:CheY-like chemotaxis protein
MPERVHSIPSESSTVLVVDDETLVRMLASEGLQELGYPVLEAADADEALKMLESHPEIEVLFTDIRMQGLNGFLLAKHARELRPDLKIIFATAYSFDRPSGEIILTKPYRLSELQSVLSTVLDH